jgi:hypothetical protein
MKKANEIKTDGCFAVCAQKSDRQTGQKCDERVTHCFRKKTETKSESLVCCRLSLLVARRNAMPVRERQEKEADLGEDVPALVYYKWRPDRTWKRKTS